MRAFTLLELLVVLIIVGILAGLAIPNYTKTRERALNREAQTALSLIQAGERIYSLRVGSYIACANTDATNTNLKLNLPLSGAWSYNVIVPPNAGDAGFTARAARSGGTRIFKIDSDDSEASCIAFCI